MAARGIRRRSAAIAGAVLSVILLAAGCAPDKTLELDLVEQASGGFPDDVSAELDAAVQSAMAATASTGALVGVWAPWSGSWLAGLGTDATGATVTPDMTFRIADLTRLMTCDVLYAVASEGTVSLQDPVTDYVVGYPDLHDATLLDLCNGTAGLGSFEPVIGAQWYGNPERVWDPLEIAAFGLGQPRSAVGTEYRDSDAGFMLLGMALERATRLSAAAMYERYIVEPLGLVATSLPRAAASAPGAQPLHGAWIPTNPDGTLNCAEPRDVSVMSSSAGFTDAGVVSSLEDLGLYLQAMASGAIGGEAVSERFSEPLPAYSGAPAWYTATGGALIAGSLIGQMGAMPGYLTAGFTDPDTGMTVVVVLNNSTADAANAAYLAWQLAAIASSAPAASGFTAPELGLPWTAQQYGDAVAQINVCR